MSARSKQYPDSPGNRANAVAHYRRVLGLSQQKLADLAGINIRQIQKYESGEYDLRNMTLANGLALAKALEILPDDLLESTPQVELSDKSQQTEQQK